MNKGMTTCKVCGNELAKSAKRCPHCGAKNTRPIYTRWWLWIFIALVLYLAVDIITARMNVRKANEVEDYNYLDYEYTNVSISDMLTTLKKNPLQAESMYVGNYIKFSGYIEEYIRTTDTCSAAYIPSSEEKSLSSFAVEDTINRTGLWCELNAALQPISYNREKITVWGKVLSARDDYDTFKYEVEILHYEFDQAIPDDEIAFTDYTANDLIEKYMSDGENAEESLYNQYVTITAPLFEIEKDHISFMRSDSGKFIVGGGWLTCPLVTDEQRELIADSNIGDILTVKGRISYMHQSAGTSTIEIETIDIVRAE